MKTYNISIEGQTIAVPEEIGSDDEKVRAVLAPYFPGAANSLISRTEKDETVTVSVVKKAGSKGVSWNSNEAGIGYLSTCPSRQNPAIELYHEIEKAGGIESMDPDELLAFDARIAQAIKDGEAQAEMVKHAQARLDAAVPQPSQAVVTGF